MSEVVKKGLLSVKRSKNRLTSSSYKQKYVVLRISPEEHGKLVEIWESQTSEKDPYRLVLGNSWTVQDKPSSSGKKYTFQLLVEGEVVLTLGCSSFMEREEWTNAFGIFKKMALPVKTAQTVAEHPSPQPSSCTDEKGYFSVFLSKTHSSLEIHCGQYMLSVGNDSICLHWITTAAIAHHWPRKYVQELGIRNSNLVLKVCKPGSSNVMEFEFRATNSTTVAILKRWNIVLMESIAANCGDPEQMNYIGKVLNKRVSDSPDGRLTKSFRKRSQSTKEKHSDSVKRSGSFSNTRSATLHPGMMGNSLNLQSENSSPRKTSLHSNNSKLSGEMGEVAKPSRMQSSPPPLPPRPILDDSSSDEDSDYAYIEENEVKGPNRSSQSLSQEQVNGERTLDQKLEELELSMKREKKEKKRKAAQEKRKAVTVAARPYQLRSPLPPFDTKMPFAAADPEDYLEPLSVLNSTRPRSTGDYETPVLRQNRSCSEPVNSLSRDGNSLSQPTIHTLRTTPPSLTPTPEHTTPPALPSRCWQDKGSVSSTNDPDISPYAVVKQILPGKILEEPNPDTALSDAPLKVSPTPQEPHQDLPSEQTPGDSSAATTPPSAPSSSTTVDSTPHTDAPPIPPRSPIREKLSWGSSTSSLASNHSHKSGHTHSARGRCTKCPQKRRAPVDKTLSEHRIQPVPQSMPSDLEKSSLPDLNAAAGVPENSLQQRRQRVHRGRLTSATESRSSSDGSTSSLQSQGNTSYLEIVPNTQSTGHKVPDNMLDDVLQCLDNRFHSLTQPSETHKPSPSPHSPSQNGQGPRRVNGSKDPPPFLRSHTAATFFNHTPLHTHPLAPNKSFSSASMRVPPPPVPPRSDISLGQPGQRSHFPSNHPPTHPANYHARPWGRTGSSGSFTSTSGDSRSPPALHGMGRTRQSSSSSIHSGSPSPTIGPAPPPRSLQHLARHFTHVPDTEGSSTVFIHHLKHDRRVMHSHMV